jgi:hypothetical protein
VLLPKKRKSKVSDFDRSISSAVFILTAPCSERSAIKYVSMDWKLRAEVQSSPHEMRSEEMNKSMRERNEFIWPKIGNK